MKGGYKVKVWEDRRSYTFYVDRQITILTGNSGIGKTSLFNLLWDSIFNGNGAVHIECEKEIIPIALPVKNWEKVLDTEKDSILLIDEVSLPIYTKEFAEYINGNSNYFILITRELLENIPYSVKSVYTLNSEKNSITNVWEYSFDNVYKFGAKHCISTIDTIVTEDSQSGYEFFSNVANECTLVKTSNGNSNMPKCIIESKGCTLAIADGSAFGPYMKKCYPYLKENSMCSLWLPESFEWLLLNSGCLNNIIADITELKDIIDEPYEYIDSVDYMTYERFFTEYLIKATHGIHGWQYSKSKLDVGYKSEKFISAFKERYKNILKLE